MFTEKRPPTEEEIYQNQKDILYINDNILNYIYQKGKCFDEYNSVLWNNSQKFNQNIYLYRDENIDDMYYCLSEYEISLIKEEVNKDQVNLTKLILVKPNTKPVTKLNYEIFFNREICEEEQKYSKEFQKLVTDNLVKFYNKFFGQIMDEKEQKYRYYKKDDLISLDFLNVKDDKYTIQQLINLIIILSRNDNETIKEIKKVILQRINTMNVCLYYQRNKKPDKGHEKIIKTLNKLLKFLKENEPEDINLIYSLARLDLYLKIFNRIAYSIGQYNNILKNCIDKKYSNYIITVDDIYGLKKLFNKFRVKTNLLIEDKLENYILYEEITGEISDNLINLPNKDDENDLFIYCIEKPAYYYPYGYIKISDNEFKIFIDRIKNYIITNTMIPAEGIYYPELGYKQYYDSRKYDKSQKFPFGYSEYPNGKYFIYTSLDPRKGFEVDNLVLSLVELQFQRSPIKSSERKRDYTQERIET